MSQNQLSIQNLDSRVLLLEDSLASLSQFSLILNSQDQTTCSETAVVDMSLSGEILTFIKGPVYGRVKS